MLLEIGEAFCTSLADMIEKDQAKVNNAVKDLKKLMKKGPTNVPYLPLSPEPKSATNLHPSRPLESQAKSDTADS